MAKQNFGLIHVYTGNGKGKTSASIGLAVRAVGQGLKVHIIQFMKGGAYTGEMISALNFLPNIKFHQFGRHCIKEIKQIKLLGFDKGHRFYDKVRDDIVCGECRFCFLNDEQQKKFVEEGFKMAQKVFKEEENDLVVLDEINVAMSMGFLDVQRVVELLKTKPPNTEVVVSGRGAPKEIMDIADYVTELVGHKHPFDTKGLNARRGIEY